MKQPSRRERVQTAVLDLDPLANLLGSNMLFTKGDHIYRLWQRLERFAHHGGSGDSQEFQHCLEALERAILDLLAPITAQDHEEMQALLGQSGCTEADVVRLFELMERKGANYKFFFEQADDPCWIAILKERGCFSQLPNQTVTGDGQIIAPYWWPLHFLRRIAEVAPEDVVDVVLELPEFANLRIQQQILAIALRLPGVLSTKLKAKLLPVSREDLPFSGFLHAELLAYWMTERQTQAALDLSERLVQFGPDPHLERMQSLYSERGIDSLPRARPLPWIGEWAYQKE